MAVREQDAALWQEYLSTYDAWRNAETRVLAENVDRVSLLREVLRGRDRQQALSLCPALSVEERQQLLPEFVNISRSAHGPFQAAWDLIEALPREWVVAHIGPLVDAILGKEEEDDYWMFQQLYFRLDPGLALMLAKRAAAHADPDIHELGEDYLARLSGQALTANGR